MQEPFVVVFLNILKEIRRQSPTPGRPPTSIEDEGRKKTERELRQITAEGEDQGEKSLIPESKDAW